MRKRFVMVVAALFVLGLSPAAQAGPGSGVCRAATNAYELATGKDAPWACLQ